MSPTRKRGRNRSPSLRFGLRSILSHFPAVALKSKATLSFGQFAKGLAMRHVITLGSLFALGALALVVLLLPATDVRGKPGDKPRKEYGIDKRVPWTTSQVKGSPEPPSPYMLENAFPKLKFDSPIELVPMPGTNRLVVAQQHGESVHFREPPRRRRRSTYSSTLKHRSTASRCTRSSPRTATSTSRPCEEEDKPEGTKLSRFKVTKTDPPEADPASETVILTWPSGGHNGGCLRFGPDGYPLHRRPATAAASPTASRPARTSTTCSARSSASTWTSADGGKTYAIPTDNPFVEHEGRPAGDLGLRPPPAVEVQLRHRDRRPVGRRGRPGPVGDGLPHREGRQLRLERAGGRRTRSGPSASKGPTPILPPVVEHTHTDFRSITGGFVYHGKRLPELEGRLHLRRLRHRPRLDAALRREGEARHRAPRAGDTHAAHRRLRPGPRPARSTRSTSSDGGIYQLVAGPARRRRTRPKFPRKLSETGLFASTKDHTPAPGLIPYSVNAELWSDGATQGALPRPPGRRRRSSSRR